MSVSPPVTSWFGLNTNDVNKGDFMSWAQSVEAEFARIADTNLLINPRLNINQRIFSGGALAAGVYGYDRWKAGPAGCNVTASGSSDTITLASGTMRQVIEAGVWDYMAGATLTFSVEDLTGGNLTVNIGTKSGSIVAGAGRKSLTVTLGGGETGNITVDITPSAGAVSFSRPKLEFGSSPTGWRARPSWLELSLCQRYYAKQAQSNVNPTGAIWTNMFGFATISTRMNSPDIYFPVEMRANPTITFVRAPAPVHSNPHWSYNAGGWVEATDTTVAVNGRKYFSAFIYGTGLTAGATYLCAGGYIAEAEL